MADEPRDNTISMQAQTQGMLFKEVRDRHKFEEMVAARDRLLAVWLEELQESYEIYVDIYTVLNGHPPE